MIDQVLRDIGQPRNLFAGLVACPGDEALHLADRRRQIGQRRVQVGFAVVDDAGERGQAAVELLNLHVAVAQRADEGLQVFDDVDDVAAAVGEDPADARQLTERLAQLVAVALEGVGGAVDEPAHRRARYPALGSQIRCQPHQLGFDLVPLDRHSRALDRDDRPVAHDRTAVPIGRRKLNVAGGHQVRGDDHRLRVRRNRHVMVDLEDHLGLRALRLNGFDGADFHTRNPHLVMRIDRGGRGEVGGDRLRPEERVANEHGGSGDQEPDQGNHRHGRQSLARDPGGPRNHCDPPVRPPNVQPGHIGMEL